MLETYALTPAESERCERWQADALRRHYVSPAAAAEPGPWDTCERCGAAVRDSAGDWVTVAGGRAECPGRRP